LAVRQLITLAGLQFNDHFEGEVGAARVLPWLRV
jgi:hypothetical protein